MSRTAKCGLAVVSLFLVASTLEGADRKGKTISVVGKRHGPWIIQVVTMKSETAKQRTLDAKRGKALVGELRRRGIPAYLIVRNVNVEQRGAKKGAKLKYSETVVLAGNYQSDSATIARKTLDYVRRFGDSPFVKGSKQLRDLGKAFRRAFLRPNPFL